MAYCAGYTAAFIASFFIPFAAFAKPAATAAKLKKGLAPAEMLADISNKTAKVSKFVMDGSRRAAGQMLELLDDILKLMALGLEELTAFLEDIFKKMAEWLMKNKKVVESLAAKAKQLFAKESKADALFRDVTKILIKYKGVLNEKQFFKIAEQIKKHFGVDMFWIDRNSVKFAELFKKWQNRPIFACFHDHGFVNGRYGIFLDGPAIYFFKGFDKLGNLFEITAYTLQHELIHLKLWHKMNVEFKELAALYKKIPDVLHEADVIGTMLKQNKYGAAVKWSMDDILLDLKTLNDNIIQYPNWNKAAQKLFGKTELTLKDLEKWDISNYLNKI